MFFGVGTFNGGGKNFTNKKGLFYAKFFEFEEFSIEPFFCSSIQPQHTVYLFEPVNNTNLFLKISDL